MAKPRKHRQLTDQIACDHAVPLRGRVGAARAALPAPNMPAPSMKYRRRAEQIAVGDLEVLATEFDNDVALTDRNCAAASVKPSPEDGKEAAALTVGVAVAACAHVRPDPVLRQHRLLDVVPVALEAEERRRANPHPLHSKVGTLGVDSDNLPVERGHVDGEVTQRPGRGRRDLRSRAVRVVRVGVAGDQRADVLPEARDFSKVD